MKTLIAIVALLLVAFAGFQVYQQQQREMREEQAGALWPAVEAAPTITRLDSFLLEYGETTLAHTAQMMRDSLKQEIDWQAANGAGTLESYQLFREIYSSSRHQKELENSLEKLRAAKDWQTAKNSKSIQVLKDFLEKHPASRFAAKAEARIIDLEVNKIFAGKHGALPPAQKVSGAGSGVKNTMEIENGTAYTLTVRFSGVRSRKLVLAPKATGSVVLASGQYRVAASVNASNVIPFAGEQMLSGGRYANMFYISGLASK